MAKVFDGINRKKGLQEFLSGSTDEEHGVHTEFQEEEIERNIKVLEASGIQAEKLERKIEKRLLPELEELGTEAAKRIHVVSRGFCPDCGSKIKQHLYTNICLDCGWNHYTVPPDGPVTLHLEDGHIIEGDACYNLKTGDILVIKQDVVIARVKKDACQYIEYGWTDDDLKKKHEQHLVEQQLTCSWCADEANPAQEGFSIAYIALGTYQNRYIFCGNECLSAFQDRYPSRVHRNCYETDCNACNLCIKRFDTTWDSYQVITKHTPKEGASDAS